jgi:peroxiredoxin
LRDAHDTIRHLGADLLAIAAEPAAALSTAVAAAPYPFPLLPDPELTVITPYGLADPAETDDAGRPIARPALFLLDRRAVVRYAHVGEHARDRPALPAILLALETMPG